MYIHQKNFIHCDLKIENLLFYETDIIKLCDFGSVRNYNLDFALISDKNFHTYMEEFEKQTTFMYRPPEMCDPYLGFKVNT